MEALPSSLDGTVSFGGGYVGVVFSPGIAWEMDVSGVPAFRGGGTTDSGKEYGL